MTDIAANKTIQPAYLKAGEAAAYLGISRRHLHTLSKRGIIPHAKLGAKCLIYRRASLDEVFDRHMVGS